MAGNPITNSHGADDARWEINAGLAPRTVGTAVNRLISEKAAYVRGFLRELSANAVLAHWEAEAAYQQLRQPSWKVVRLFEDGWVPGKPIVRPLDDDPTIPFAWRRQYNDDEILDDE